MSITTFVSYFARLLHTSTRPLLQQILPTVCLLCGYRTSTLRSLCGPCYNDLPILSQSCRQCAQKLQGKMHASRCGYCQKHPPAFSHTFALFPYQGPVVSLITQLKFRHELSHANLLGELLAEHAMRDWYQALPLPDVILPVPIHAKRLRERGFNQAVEIGRPLSKYLGIPLDIIGASRHRETAAQSGLTATERRHNVTNAFTITSDYTGLTVAILDDVITTGHTIRAFSKAVKAAGAADVHVWCCARAG